MSDSCQNKILEFFFKHFLKINLEIFCFFYIFLKKNKKNEKVKKNSRFDLRILDIMGVSDSCQTTCLMFKVKKTLCMPTRISNSVQQCF